MCFGDVMANTVGWRGGGGGGGVISMCSSVQSVCLQLKDMDHEVEVFFFFFVSVCLVSQRLLL